MLVYNNVRKLDFQANLCEAFAFKPLVNRISTKTLEK